MASGISRPAEAPLTQPAPAATHEQTPSTSPSTSSGDPAGPANSGQSAALAPALAGHAWWFWPLAGLIGLLLLGTIAWGVQIRPDVRAPQARTARALRRPPSAAAPPRMPKPRRSKSLPEDDDLLRELLGE